MRLLHWLRQDLNIFEAIVVAFVIYLFLAAGLENVLDRLLEFCGAFIGFDTEGAKLSLIECAASTPIDAPTGENIEQRDFFGEAQRMVERGERDGGADAKPFGSSRNLNSH